MGWSCRGPGLWSRHRLNESTAGLDPGFKFVEFFAYSQIEIVVKGALIVNSLLKIRPISSLTRLLRVGARCV